MIASNRVGFWHVVVALANPSGRVTSRRPEMAIATCPECDAEVEVDEVDTDVGDEVSCPECGQNLVVSGTEPIELDFADEDDDDDDDDEEDEEEDDDEAELDEEDEEREDGDIEE
jgi:lysine biosynthesis protein LysW